MVLFSMVKDKLLLENNPIRWAPKTFYQYITLTTLLIKIKIR